MLSLARLGAGAGLGGVARAGFSADVPGTRGLAGDGDAAFPKKEVRESWPELPPEEPLFFMWGRE